MYYWLILSLVTIQTLFIYKGFKVDIPYKSWHNLSGSKPQHFIFTTDHFEYIRDFIIKKVDYILSYSFRAFIVIFIDVTSSNMAQHYALYDLNQALLKCKNVISKYIYTQLPPQFLILPHNLLTRVGEKAHVDHHCALWIVLHFHVNKLSKYMKIAYYYAITQMVNNTNMTFRNISIH